MIPIWVGRQSPCACKPGSSGTWPSCTQFTYQIGPDTATAASQGTADAKAAEGVAAGLISSGTHIIYKDVENYDPTIVLSNGATCGSVVNAYLNNWDSQLHQDSYSAGAYGNPTPLANWYANVSPLPDDVWIAQANSKVTIWNLGIQYGMTDSMWPALQRIHQYAITHNEAWGGTTSFGIDSDIVNAEIISNNGETNYDYEYTDVDCTNLGATLTNPNAINDMSNGALITGRGQMGTIVGYYYDANHVLHGFQNTSGTCSPIDVPGAYATIATGINNLGQIVVYSYASSGGKTYGFLKNPGQNPSQVAYAGAYFTVFYGVNDAGQVVGVAYDIYFVPIQPFVYYGGQFYAVGSLNPDSTLPFGINGEATIAGYDRGGSPNFEEALLAPAWTGTITAPNPGGYVLGINANDELVGGGYGGSCDEEYGCGFMWAGSLLTNIFQFPGAIITEADGINDFGQVVGYYQDSNGDHAILWSPQ